MDGKPAEHRFYPVPVQVLYSWAQASPQFPFPVQFHNKRVVVNIMLPPHDRTSGIIEHHIAIVVDRMCPLMDADIRTGTGCINLYPTKISDHLVTTLGNGIRKNGDGHICTNQGAQSTHFPGVVIELGYSDTGRKSQRTSDYGWKAQIVRYMIFEELY
jgi:hypothetical protein